MNWVSLETDEEIRSLYEATEGSKTGVVTKISEKYTVSKDAVRSRARRLGLAESQTPWISTTRLEQIRQRYPTEGAQLLAEEWGLTPSQIHNKARRLGLQMENPEQNRQYTRSHNNRTVNYRYFDGPWTPNKAYILGYTWADGTVRWDERYGSYGLGLECARKDEKIILDIREELDSKHAVGRKPAKVDHRGVYNGPKTCCFIQSKLLAQILIEDYHILPRKSFINLPYPEIPDDCLNHFSRGYLDGDGCVSDKKSYRGRIYGSLYFKGSHRFIEGMAEQVCRILGVRRNKLIRDGTTSTAKWAAQKDLLKFYPWLYPTGDYLYGRRKKLCLKRQIDRINLGYYTVAS